MWSAAMASTDASIRSNRTTIARSPIDEAIAWQDKELAGQEATAVGALKAAGMTVIEPDVALFRKPVLEQVPKKFEDKWGKGTWDTIQAL